MVRRINTAYYAMRSKSSTVLLTQKALLKPLALVWGD